MKIGRNDPCPCGPGLKSKRCCNGNFSASSGGNAVGSSMFGLGSSTPTLEENSDSLKQAAFLKQQSVGAQNAFWNSTFLQGMETPGGQHHKDIREFAASQNFSSLEDANLRLADFVNQRNNLPVADFLGLSPSQISDFLYEEKSLSNSVFCLKPEKANNLSEQVILREIRFFLLLLSDAGELKLTATKAFPKKIVSDFCVSFRAELFGATGLGLTEMFLPKIESDLWVLSFLKILLSDAGLVKVRNGKMSLTKKGVGYVEPNQAHDAELYLNLLSMALWKVNWNYFSRYIEFPDVQNFTLFLLWALKQRGSTPFDADEFTQLLLTAFPQLIKTVEPHPYWKNGGINLSVGYFFLRNICLQFGLVQNEPSRPAEEKTKDLNLSASKADYYKTTSFFESIFEVIHVRNKSI